MKSSLKIASHASSAAVPSAVRLLGSSFCLFSGLGGRPKCILVFSVMCNKAGGYLTCFVARRNVNNDFCILSLYMYLFHHRSEFVHQARMMLRGWTECSSQCLGCPCSRQSERSVGGFGQTRVIVDGLCDEVRYPREPTTPSRCAGLL